MIGWPRAHPWSPPSPARPLRRPAAQQSGTPRSPSPCCAAIAGGQPAMGSAARATAWPIRTTDPHNASGVGRGTSPTDAEETPPPVTPGSRSPGMADTMDPVAPTNGPTAPDCGTGHILDACTNGIPFLRNPFLRNPGCIKPTALLLALFVLTPAKLNANSLPCEVVGKMILGNHLTLAESLQQPCRFDSFSKVTMSYESYCLRTPGAPCKDASQGLPASEPQ